MSSPVQLTVGKETTLLLSVAPVSGFNYTVSGRLLWGEQAVSGKQIAVKVNGEVKAAATTTADGSYTVTLELPAVDNVATDYRIEVVFYGDNWSSLTGMATLPNGTEYAVCTLQYSSYMPTANSTMLTVEPQSTQEVRQTQTRGKCNSHMRGFWL